MSQQKKILIMGAAGRDFHNFNVYFRSNPSYKVIAYTAAQIPDIAGRKYPADLSGDLYPDGIPIYPEDDLEQLIKKHDIEEVYFSYSDVPYSIVMNQSARVNAAGADFILLGCDHTMISSSKPVIAVCAVRTGCGKSQVSRALFEILRKQGLRVSSIRHPMPYDKDLSMQSVQRFASYDDLDRYNCTIEEREEYEPYIDMGGVIYAGVDYERILRTAEQEADVIIWDGGNNDFSFIKPDLLLTLADPHRPGHECAYYPGEVNARSADIVIINKVNTAETDHIDQVRSNIKQMNPDATIINGISSVILEEPEKVKGKRVLIIEDGPTVTHGEMSFGAGMVAALNHDVGEIIDPRAFAVDSIQRTFEKYTHLQKVLPAMGYGKEQMKDLEETINRCDCDVVISGTPIDITRVIQPKKPIVRVRYGVGQETYQELEKIVKQFIQTHSLQSTTQ